MSSLYPPPSPAESSEPMPTLVPPRPPQAPPGHSHDFAARTALQFATQASAPPSPPPPPPPSKPPPQQPPPPSGPPPQLQTSTTTLRTNRPRPRAAAVHPPPPPSSPPPPIAAPPTKVALMPTPAAGQSATNSRVKQVSEMRAKVESMQRLRHSLGRGTTTAINLSAASVATDETADTQNSGTETMGSNHSKGSASSAASVSSAVSADDRRSKVSNEQLSKQDDAYEDDMVLVEGVSGSISVADSVRSSRAASQVSAISELSGIPEVSSALPAASLQPPAPAPAPETAPAVAHIAPHPPPPFPSPPNTYAKELQQQSKSIRDSPESARVSVASSVPPLPLQVGPTAAEGRSSARRSVVARPPPPSSPPPQMAIRKSNQSPPPPGPPPPDNTDSASRSSRVAIPRPPPPVNPPPPSSVAHTPAPPPPPPGQPHSAVSRMPHAPPHPPPPTQPYKQPNAHDVAPPPGAAVHVVLVNGRPPSSVASRSSRASDGDPEGSIGRHPPTPPPTQPLPAAPAPPTTPYPGDSEPFRGHVTCGDSSVGDTTEDEEDVQSTRSAAMVVDQHERRASVHSAVSQASRSRRSSFASDSSAGVHTGANVRVPVAIPPMLRDPLHVVPAADVSAGGMPNNNDAPAIFDDEPEFTEQFHQDEGLVTVATNQSTGSRSVEDWENEFEDEDNNDNNSNNSNDKHYFVRRGETLMNPSHQSEEEIRQGSGDDARSVNTVDILHPPTHPPPSEPASSSPHASIVHSSGAHLNWSFYDGREQNDVSGRPSHLQQQFEDPNYFSARQLQESYGITTAPSTRCNGAFESDNMVNEYANETATATVADEADDDEALLAQIRSLNQDVQREHRSAVERVDSKGAAMDRTAISLGPVRQMSELHCAEFLGRLEAVLSSGHRTLYGAPLSSFESLFAVLDGNDDGFVTVDDVHDALVRLDVHATGSEQIQQLSFVLYEVAGRSADLDKHLAYGVLDHRIACKGISVLLARPFSRPRARSGSLTSRKQSVSRMGCAQTAGEPLGFGSSVSRKLSPLSMRSHGGSASATQEQQRLQQQVRRRNGSVRQLQKQQHEVEQQQRHLNGMLNEDSSRSHAIEHKRRTMLKQSNPSTPRRQRDHRHEDEQRHVVNETRINTLQDMSHNDDNNNINKGDKHRLSIASRNTTALKRTQSTTTTTTMTSAGTRSRKVRQLVRWINSLNVWPSIRDMADETRSGVLLCRVIEKLRRLRESDFRMRGVNLHARARASALANIELALAVVWKSKVRTRNIPSAAAIYEAQNSRPAVALFSEIFMALGLPHRAQLLDMMSWYSDVLRTYDADLGRPSTLVLDDPWSAFGDGVLLVHVIHFFCGDTGIMSAGLPPVNRSMLCNPPRDEEESSMNIGYLFGLLVEAAVPCPWSPKDFALAQDSRMLIVQLWFLFERFEHMHSAVVTSPRGGDRHRGLQSGIAHSVADADSVRSGRLVRDDGGETESGLFADWMSAEDQSSLHTYGRDEEANSNASHVLEPPARVRRALDRITDKDSSTNDIDTQPSSSSSPTAAIARTSPRTRRPTKSPPPPPPSLPSSSPVHSSSPFSRANMDNSNKKSRRGHRASSPDRHRRESVQSSTRRSPPPPPALVFNNTSPLRHTINNSRRPSLAHEHEHQAVSNSVTTPSSTVKQHREPSGRRSERSKHHQSTVDNTNNNSNKDDPERLLALVESSSKTEKIPGRSHATVNHQSSRQSPRGEAAITAVPSSSSSASASSWSSASDPERVESLTGALTSLSQPHYLILRDRNSSWRFKFKVVVRPSAMLNGGLAGAPDKITAKQCALQWEPFASPFPLLSAPAARAVTATATEKGEYDSGGHVLLSDIETLAFPVEPTRLVMQVVLKALVPRAIQTSGGRSVLEIQGSSEAEVFLFFGHLAVAIQCLNGGSPVISHVDNTQRTALLDSK